MIDESIGCSPDHHVSNRPADVNGASAATSFRHSNGARGHYDPVFLQRIANSLFDKAYGDGVPVPVMNVMQLRGSDRRVEGCAAPFQKAHTIASLLLRAAAMCNRIDVSR